MNLVFEDLGNSTTKITANTKYIVTKSLRVRDVQGKFQDSIDVITFGTGQSASFPGNEKGEVTCTSTGALEEEVLSLIKN